MANGTVDAMRKAEAGYGGSAVCRCGRGDPELGPGITGRLCDRRYLRTDQKGPGRAATKAPGEGTCRRRGRHVPASEAEALCAVTWPEQSGRKPGRGRAVQGAGSRSRALAACEGLPCPVCGARRDRGCLGGRHIGLKELLCRGQSTDGLKVTAGACRCDPRHRWQWRPPEAATAGQ